MKTCRKFCGSRKQKSEKLGRNVIDKLREKFRDIYLRNRLLSIPYSSTGQKNFYQKIFFELLILQIHVAIWGIPPKNNFRKF